MQIASLRKILIEKKNSSKQKDVFCTKEYPVDFVLLRYIFPPVIRPMLAKPAKFLCIHEMNIM